MIRYQMMLGVQTVRRKNTLEMPTQVGRIYGNITSTRPLKAHTAILSCFSNSASGSGNLNKKILKCFSFIFH